MAGHSGHGQAGASGTSTIVLRLNKPGNDPVLIQLTDGTGYAHHPVLAVPGAGLLLTAWVQENDGAPGIRSSLHRWSPQTSLSAGWMIILWTGYPKPVTFSPSVYGHG